MCFITRIILAMALKLIHTCRGSGIFFSAIKSIFFRSPSTHCLLVVFQLHQNPLSDKNYIIIKLYNIFCCLMDSNISIQIQSDDDTIILMI